MLIAVFVLVALTPGAVTAWRLRDRGMPVAVAAGTALTVLLAATCLAALAAMAPVAILLGGGCALSALHAYDRGRMAAATMWVASAMVCFWCAGVTV
jgi:hypothetical protein